MKGLLHIFFIFSFFQSGICGIPPKETNFMCPVKQTIRISGNFGELRGGHFHAGLDIKGGEGENIYAAEEGFVSRIKIQRGGYGRAIYVDHPNGYTTVYAHLSGFGPGLGEYILSEQQAVQSYEIDIRPSPTALPLKKGQVLGFLGNSGHSFGAHLHFEIRESLSDNPMNPMLFNIKPFDDQAPIINSVRITGLDESFKRYGTNKFSTKRDKTGNYQVMNIETREPIIGLSIAGFDQNNFGSNRNGIYRMKMYVNGAPYYSFNMNAFSFDETHLIEVHTEFEERSNKEIACYKLPGNKLTVIDQEINSGLVYLTDSVNTEVMFVLTDFHGNTATQIVNILKIASSERLPEVENNSLLRHGIKHQLSKEDLNVTINENTLPRDIPVPIYISTNYRGIKEYSIGHGKYPVLAPITISASLPEQLYNLSDKVGLMLLGSNPNFFGQKVNGTTYTIDAMDFGRFGFFVDTIGPRITPQNFPSKGKLKSETLRFKLTDNITPRGVKPFSYTVFLDGVWLPCEMKETSDIVTVPVRDLVGGSHHLLIKAVDQFNNESIWEGVFETAVSSP
jgi:hypothetical protein